MQCMSESRGQIPFVKYDADGRIDQDLPCLKCGYNLRTLFYDDECPECSTSVHEAARLTPDGRRGCLAELCEAGPPRGCMVVLTAATAALAIVLALAVELGFPPGETRNAQRWIWQITAVLAGFSCLALIFRLGWLVPCTVIGVFLGYSVCAPALSRGDAGSQMQDQISDIWCGAFFGIIVGLAMDLLPRLSRRASDYASRCTSCGYYRRPGLTECPGCGTPYTPGGT